MDSRLFEVLEQLMIETVLIKLTQFEKTGKIFIPQGNSIIIRPRFPLHFYCSIVELKKKSKSNREKLKLSLNKF